MQDVTLLVFDDGAYRHGQVEGFTICAMAQIPFTGLTVGGLSVWLVVIVQQRGDIWVGDEHDVTTVATVASIWSTEGFEFFARSEEHTSELQSRGHLVCRLLLASIHDAGCGT